MLILTQAADVDGDVHVAVFGAVVHGLSQGPQPGLPRPLERPLLLGVPHLARLRALGQDLLQRQDIALLLLRLGEKLPEHVPGGPRVKRFFFFQTRVMYEDV